MSKSSAEIDTNTAVGKSENSDLLCCPFCGCDAELDTHRAYRCIDGRMGDAVAIYCAGEDYCPADMSICREDAQGATTEQLTAELKEFWNRRAT